jgi:hypothetical protein
MKGLRSNAQFLCIFMAVLMLIVSTPCQSVLAALIDTETVLDSVRGQDAHNQVKQFLSREDVKAALIAHGIDPMEAKRRINALSDEEVLRIADQIDQLPTGGGAAEAVLVILLVFFLVLVILDLTGVTDVFPFIKSQK